jgi:hypothetical protein
MNFSRTIVLTSLACCAVASAAASARAQEAPTGPPITGKYGCSESVYTTDGYTQEARGFVSLLAENRYRQGKGKVGTYSYSAKSGITRFKGGGLGGSTATAMDGKRDRLFIKVHFISGKTANWACSRIGKA